jgi:DNA invertase Pin-like site-specific DNA recombinase
MTSPFPEGARIFAYLRDSGSDEQELSISQQERHIRQWALDNGLIVEQVFPDAARPGSSVIKRDQLQAMMHAFRNGAAVAGVVIWKWSRFARNVDDAQLYRAEIRSRGYIFHSMNDEIPEGPIGRIFEAILDYHAEEYLSDLSIDVTRGLHDLVANFKCVPGTPPTGFKREPVVISYHRDGTPRTASRWVPDPLVVPRLVRAFDLYVAGHSLATIHRETHLCKAINSYSTLWENKLYIGVLEYGDQVVENYCEPVIERATWEAAQARRAKYARHRNAGSDSYDHPRRANSRYLLSGLARCARCGSPLYGHTSQVRGRNGVMHEYESYYCSQAPRQRNCTRRRIPRQAFEQAVIENMRAYILDPKFIRAGFERLQSQQSGQLAEIDVRLAEVAAQLGDVRKQQGRISKAIRAAGHSRVLLRDLAALEADETELLSRQADLQNKRQPVTEISAERLAELLPAAHKLLVDGTDEQKRLVLRAFIDHIDVEREGNVLRGIIYYKYPPAPGGISADESILPGGAFLTAHILQMPFRFTFR